MKQFILLFTDGTSAETNGANLEEMTSLYLNEIVRCEDGMLRECMSINYSTKNILKEENTCKIINMLIGVDGETMQYILDRLGMSDQMLRQLVMSQPIGEVVYMFEERKKLEEFNKKLTYR